MRRGPTIDEIERGRVAEEGVVDWMKEFLGLCDLPLPWYVTRFEEHKYSAHDVILECGEVALTFDVKAQREDTTNGVVNADTHQRNLRLGIPYILYPDMLLVRTELVTGVRPPTRGRDDPYLLVRPELGYPFWSYLAMVFSKLVLGRNG